MRYVLHVVDARTGACRVAAEARTVDEAMAKARAMNRGTRHVLIEDRATGVVERCVYDGTARAPVDVPLQGLDPRELIGRLDVTPTEVVEAVGLGLVRAGIAWGIFRLIVGRPRKGLQREATIAGVAGLVGITGIAFGYHRLLRRRTDATAA